MRAFRCLIVTKRLLRLAAVICLFGCTPQVSAPPLATDAKRNDGAAAPEDGASAQHEPAGDLMASHPDLGLGPTGDLLTIPGPREAGVADSTDTLVDLPLEQQPEQLRKRVVVGQTLRVLFNSPDRYSTSALGGLVSIWLEVLADGVHDEGGVVVSHSIQPADQPAPTTHTHTTSPFSRTLDILYSDPAATSTSTLVKYSLPRATRYALYLRLDSCGARQECEIALVHSVRRPHYTSPSSLNSLNRYNAVPASIETQPDGDGQRHQLKTDNLPVQAGSWSRVYLASAGVGLSLEFYAPLHEAPDGSSAFALRTMGSPAIPGPIEEMRAVISAHRNSLEPIHEGCEYWGSGADSWTRTFLQLLTAEPQNYAQAKLNAISATPSRDIGVCALEVGKRYYLNISHVTCPDGFTQCGNFILPSFYR